MKINKNIFTITGVFLFIISSISAQIRLIKPEKISYDEYIGIMPFNDDLYIYLKKSGEDIADFSFNWGNSFDVAVANEALLRRAYELRKRDWFNKQKNLIKKNIESKLGEIFDNYNQAKDALFLNSEYANLYNNIKIPQSKYASRRSKGFAKTKAYSKELLLLRQRKLEIEYGNINNSFVEGFKVNGIDLKDLKSISSININWAKIENPLITNLATTFIDNDIYKKINNLGIEFNNEIVRLKNNYYNSFDEWEQLNLIQFLLNYERYKEMANCFVCIQDDNPFYKFHEVDVTTSEVIEQYAINNREGGHSFFSEIGRDAYIGWPASSSHFLAIQKRQEYEEEKEKRLNNLIGSYSIFNTKDIDFLVFFFNNSNSNEQTWLNYNSNRAKEMADYLGLVIRHSSQQHAHYLYNRDIKPEIELGGKFVGLTKELDLDLTDYSNIPQSEMNQVYNRVDFIYSKINTISKENINQLSAVDQQLVLQDILFVTMFPGIRSLDSSNSNLISELSNDVINGEIFIFNKYLKLFQDTPIKFSTLWDNYDDIKGTHLINENKEDFSNYCAINLSHALLNTGISLNNFKGVKCWGCKNLKNNNKHAIRAQELANWLKTNSSNINGVKAPVFLTGNNFENFIDGKKGIVFFKDYWQRDSDSGTNRTGDHIDLWDGNELAGSSWFWTRFRLTLPWIAERFGSSDLRKSTEVIFWEIID